MTEELITTEEQETIFDGVPQEVMRFLTPSKNRAILLYITGQYTVRKIAEIIGVTEQTIRIWLNQPAVQCAIKELQCREFHIIDSSLKALRMKAVNTMNELLDSPMDPVRFQASKDILDRTGHKPAAEMKIDKTVTTIEKQLKDLADVTIADSEVIDITDIIEQVKNG